MYFTDRKQAGRMLAAQIAKKYPTGECAVVALSDGGVLVGAPIAQEMLSVICMLLVEEIQLPREITSIAGILQDGSFSYNPAYAQGEIDEMVSEYHGLIEQQKLEKMHRMNQTIGNNDLIRRDLLQHKNVILVSDGIDSVFPLDLAMQFLKPIRMKKLIVATPLATIGAVDRMHIIADDIFCLSVPHDYMDTDHYYDKKEELDHHDVIEAVAKIVKTWK